VSEEQRKKARKFCAFGFFFTFASSSHRYQMEKDVKQYLFRRLKEENSLWSYDVSKMKSISDEALIEHVMLYLDINDINRLFSAQRGLSVVGHSVKLS
jgi:ABC-type transporter MlaC component